MCKIYGCNLWTLFFYDHGSPQVHVQELYDKIIGKILLPPPPVVVHATIHCKPLKLSIQDCRWIKKKRIFFYTCCQSPRAMKQNLMAAGWHFLSCHPNCHGFIESFFEQSKPDDSATGFELRFQRTSASTVVRARAWQSVHHQYHHHHDRTLVIVIIIIGP